MFYTFAKMKLYYNGAYQIKLDKDYKNKIELQKLIETLNILGCQDELMTNTSYSRYFVMDSDRLENEKRLREWEDAQRKVETSIEKRIDGRDVITLVLPKGE